MVKSQKLWKVEFYKNDDENGGAMAEAIKQCPANNIVIHSQTKKNGRVWGYTEPTKFLSLLEKNYGLYEVITQFPHKVYFDIDKKGESTNEYLVNIKNIILEYFPEAEMAISGSIKETKTSYHIVLQNYTIHNEDERQHMKHLVKYICEHVDESFDWKVYTKNRNMKCINQSKDDGRVQEIIEMQDFKAHCITCFISDYSLPFRELPEPIKEEIMVDKSKKTFDIGMLPKLVLSTPDNFDASCATAEEILSLLPIDKNFNHDYTHLVARFCYYNDLTLEQFLSWISKKHNPLTKEVIQKWTNHFNRLDKFPSVSTDRMITILQHFYPHIKKDIHFRKFSQTFQLPIDKIEKIETINRNCFENREKYSLFNVGMGGGKTAQTISFLKNEPNFLWIAPNKALATNTKKRFEVENIDLCHYEEVSTKHKKSGKLKEVDRLIICLNSIHYIDDVKYDVLVIDEIETLLDKFLGDFLEQGKLQLKSTVWNTFVNLFRNAKKVILLDAFITTKTVNFINSLEKNVSYKIYERIFEPQKRTIKYMDDDKAMLHDIIEKIRNGQKLFIFYPYKKQSNNFMSMESMNNVIEMSTGKKGIFYNADVDDTIKSGLKDVNTSWEGKDYVITNNIITCGVNYENLDFDYTYIFIASHNTPRDIIQVSYRTRHLNSGIIKICYLGKMTPPNTWLNDCDKMRCSIYNSLYKNILIEKKAPIKRSIQLFCVKAHYKQTSESYKLSDVVRAELDKIVREQFVCVTYNQIDDIDFSQAEVIEGKCFAQQATMMDKYMLNKYYFKKSFLNENDEQLADIWDFDYSFFFRRLGQILSDENNLFNKIATENKLKSLFPVDIKKTKLSKDLKDDIFKQFSFKFITSSSATNKILKEIYNTYFGKHIVTVHYYDNSKDPTYKMNEDVYQYYEYAKNNLILDSLTYMTYKQLHDATEIDECVEI